jgi:hypothetical protein
LVAEEQEAILSSMAQVAEALVDIITTRRLIFQQELSLLQSEQVEAQQLLAIKIFSINQEFLVQLVNILQSMVAAVWGKLEVLTPLDCRVHQVEEEPAEIPLH